MPNDAQLYTPELAGIPIHLHEANVDTGDHIASYSLPLTQLPAESGVIHAKLGRKPTRIKLSGYLADNTAVHGSAYEQLVLLQQIINGLGKRKVATVEYRSEQGQKYAVFVAAFGFIQKRQSIGIIDVSAEMVVVGDQGIEIKADTLQAALAAADTYFYERPPAPQVNFRLPTTVQAEQTAADNAALDSIAYEFAPAPTPAAFQEEVYATRFSAAGPNYTRNDDGLTLSDILDRVNRLRKIAIDLKTLQDDPLGALQSIVGNISDLTGVDIVSSVLPADLPFTFDELLTIKAMWAAATYDPPRAREAFAGISAANPKAAAPDDPNPVAQHLYQRDEYRKSTLRRIAAAGKVLADIRGEFASREDAEAEREITNGMLTAIAPDLPVATAKLRAASERAFAESIPRLASIQEFSADSNLPAIFAAYRFTGSTEAAATLARGNIVHLTCNPPFYA